MEMLERLPGWKNRQPAYSTLPTTPTVVTDASSVQDDESQNEPADTPRAHSSLSRTLADFTLGFADGLTVPFALTAGLSSLGQTKTVIYAGMAEICAGCISMGIGGYLAAKGEQRSDLNGNKYDDIENSKSSAQSSKGQAVGDYVARLQLPPDLLHAVMAHVESSPDVAARVRDSNQLANTEATAEPMKTSPVVSGFSVALGYLLGGILPLAPYFFVSNVTEGLIWSFGICIIALFIFGFTKEYVLQLNAMNQDWESGAITHLRRDLIKLGLWEGLRMVILGGLAAVVAVLCVNLFEGVVT
ncbi:Ccc1 family [Astrocystis sublimbata]|nr:Ccc1 family [Astrocystis sublimbata]